VKSIEFHAKVSFNLKTLTMAHPIDYALNIKDFHNSSSDGHSINIKPIYSKATFTILTLLCLFNFDKKEL
jgi:hypothetical protein